MLGSELNNKRYHLLNVNRPKNNKARGGEIALVLNVNIKLLKTESLLNFKSFEVAEWTFALEDIKQPVHYELFELYWRSEIEMQSIYKNGGLQPSYK